MRGIRNIIATLLVKCADTILPDALRQWGKAMHSEALHADNCSSLSFAWGCFTTSVQIAGRHYVLSLPLSAITATLKTKNLYVSVSLIMALGLLIMYHSANLNEGFTDVTVLFALLKITPIIILGINKSKVSNILDSPWHAFLYFTSKGSGILTVAFALAAAASAGKAIETYTLAGVLVVATALTFWTIFARFTGRFYGFAQIGRPA